MLNTQCEYNYQLVGFYPVIDDSHCSTTGTIDVATSTTSMVETNQLLQMSLVGYAISIFILMFWSGYKLSGGKKS